MQQSLIAASAALQVAESALGANRAGLEAAIKAAQEDLDRFKRLRPQEETGNSATAEPNKGTAHTSTAKRPRAAAKPSAKGMSTRSQADPKKRLGAASGLKQSSAKKPRSSKKN